MIIYYSLSEVFQDRLRPSFDLSLCNNKTNPNLNITFFYTKECGPVV